MSSNIDAQDSILVRDFIECHNRLTLYMKKILKKDGKDGEHRSLIYEIARLNKDKLIASNKQYLLDLCDLRNTITHSTLQGRDEYIAVPCEATVKNISSLLNTYWSHQKPLIKL